MPATFTQRNRLTKQGVSENLNLWGAIWSSQGGSDLLDIALDGVTTLAFSASNVVLTTANGATDQSRARVLNCQGVLAANLNIVAPNIQKNYIVRNGTTGAFTLGIKTASGSAVEIQQGSSAQVWCDGNDNFYVVSATDTAAVNSLIAAHNASLSAHYPATDTQRGFVELATPAEAAAGTAGPLAITAATLKAAVLDLFFPQGTIYTTTSPGFNPAAAFGGTWVTFGAGRVLVGQDVAQTEFAAFGQVGGAKTHTLTTAELASHVHGYPNESLCDNGGDAIAAGSRSGAVPSAFQPNASGSGTAAAGSNAPHNNLQPYIVVRFWQRTA